VPYLFSTARYTCTDPAAEVTPDDVPLWPYHVARLRNAHARFVAAEGKQRWGAWVGDDAVWDSVRAAIVGKNAEGAGDWRVSTRWRFESRRRLRRSDHGQTIKGVEGTAIWQCRLDRD